MYLVWKYMCMLLFWHYMYSIHTFINYGIPLFQHSQGHHHDNCHNQKYLVLLVGLAICLIGIRDWSK
jgi:hypothetical protein